MTKDNTGLPKHNRACPKCGSSCVGVIFEDVKAGYETYVNPDWGDVYWEEFGISCSNTNCDFEIQMRSANS